MENERPDTNCLPPYKEIKVKPEAGIFYENAIRDTEEIENKVIMPNDEKARRGSLLDEVVDQSLISDGNKEGPFTTPQSEEYTVDDQYTTENRKESLKYEIARKNSKKSTMVTASKKSTKNLANTKCAEKKIDQKSHLKQKTETRATSEKKTFECEICCKRFSRKGHLEEHTRIHTGEKGFKCQVCGKAFARQNSFIRHTRLHTGEKPFDCNICDKRFSRKDHFEEHTRIHTGERPFKCEVCGKRFTRKYHLQEHKRFHTDDKPNKCEVCGKSFRHRKSFTQHLQKCV